MPPPSLEQHSSSDTLDALRTMPRTPSAEGPSQSCQLSMPMNCESGIGPERAKDYVESLMSKDIRPDLNLGSFVSTTFDDQTKQLVVNHCSKNLACKNEYPQVTSMHDHCISFLAHLWEAREYENPIGFATTGSSEAIFLAILAMKMRWQERQAKLSDRADLELNVIIGALSHVAINNGALSCGVQTRIIESVEGEFRFNARDFDKSLDSNTIGVILVLGNTFTGHFDAVEAVAEKLDQIQVRTGIDVPIHVDGASGGFVAPFRQQCLQKWNFQIPRVVSINASGHKYGMTPATVGWVLWRDTRYLPRRMVHNSEYLSGNTSSATLSYSMSASNVVIQYYKFVSLGFQGYRDIVACCFRRATALAHALERGGMFRCLSETSFNDASSSIGSLPIVVFQLTPAFRKKDTGLDEQSISQKLMDFGISVPCCSIPASDSASSSMALRVVIRPNLPDSDLAMFLKYLKLSISSQLNGNDLEEVEARSFPSALTGFLGGLTA